MQPVIFWGVRNNWHQSYNSTIIEIGAQKSQSGPNAWPNMYYINMKKSESHLLGKKKQILEEVKSLSVWKYLGRY